MAVLGDDKVARREELVRDHVDFENSGDLRTALALFERPRFEYVATDEVFDGADQVLDHWTALRRAFPDVLIEVMDLHVSDDAVLMEAVARGTHLGTFRGLPPTARRFELPFLRLFVFEGEGLVCERVYLDVNSLMTQLGVARKPLSLGGRLGTLANHPLTLGRGLARRVIRR